MLKLYWRYNFNKATSACRESPLALYPHERVSSIITFLSEGGKTVRLYTEFPSFTSEVTR